MADSEQDSSLLKSKICDPEFEAQIRECYGRVVYTHKTHEKMAEIWRQFDERAKWGQIIASALISAGALGIVLTDTPFLSAATAVLSVLSLIATAYLKNFDPGGEAKANRAAAAEMWPIRESYLSLLTDLKGGLDLHAAQARRDEFQNRLAMIYQNVPQTSPKAYREAQKALQKDEDLTFTEEEIDKFLPERLRAKFNQIS